MDETKKTAKNARHPWMKLRKRRKLVFSRGGRMKNGKNWFSAAADERKTAKISFQPRRKIKNKQILRFGCGRRTKNAENWLSAMADG